MLLTGSVAALERARSTLNAHDGRLLKRLLSRMEVVATVPVEDVRVNARGGIDRDSTWVRAPFPPAWLAVIIVMERHPDDVFASCLREAADVCHAWLSLTDGEEDRNYPGRAQAARLALRLAREAQARRAEGNRWRDDVEQAVY